MSKDKSADEQNPVLNYPTSSTKGPKNWDKIAKDVEEEEKKEQLEGDAAVNKLFQQIYADSSDEVKRAMMKSYMESKGTVLSTNWKEVAKDKVECKPPDGMEFKKWWFVCFSVMYILYAENYFLEFQHLNVYNYYMHMIWFSILVVNNLFGMRAFTNLLPSMITNLWICFWPLINLWCNMRTY